MQITDLSDAQRAAVAATMKTRLSRSIYDHDGREVVYDCLIEGPADASAVKEIAAEVESAAVQGRDMDDAELGRMFRNILLPYALRCADVEAAETELRATRSEPDADLERKRQLEDAA